MKYIVKNCPNCNHTDWDNGYGELEEGYLCNIKVDDFECKDCDCLIKQVIEKCAEPIPETKVAQVELASKILQLFKIEEV